MPLNFCFKDHVQLNFQSSTLCVSDNSSQSSGFPHLRRYSCPPSTAHDPQEQNLKSCTVQLSITSLHFLHRIIFLTIFIMHVTRSQLSALTSFFEPQIVFFKAPSSGEKQSGKIVWMDIFLGVCMVGLIGISVCLKD